MAKSAFTDTKRALRKFLRWLPMLLILAIGAGYLYLTVNGYRLNRDLTLERGGSIRILLPEPNIDVFLDQNRKGRSSSADELFSIPKVKTGEHTVIVAHKDYWPWNKKINVVSDETVQLFPFLTPKNSTGLIITEDDPEYGKIISLIHEETRRGTAEKISRDGSVRARLEGNTLLASWLGAPGTEPSDFCKGEECGGETFVFNPEREIRIFDFYRGKPNTFIVAVGNGIYVIDIGAPGNQNFHPLYTGTSPLFGFGADGTIFVKDQDSLFEIKL